MRRPVGLDFGTTNSSLAIVDDSGAVHVAKFDVGTGLTESFRSVVYFDPPKRGVSAVRPPALAGPAAINRYLDADPKGRLIQSLKSFAATKSFTSTNLFGKSYTFEDLVGIILKSLVAEAERQFGPLGSAITVGRPVHFVGDEDPAADAFALGRLTTALRLSGFTEINFVYEPIGAAYYYDRQLSRDELVLIADFGGGTSDFSLVRVGPGARGDSRDERILGSEGVGIAGDSFDACIIQRLVSPQLGVDSDIQSSLGKTLPVPAWLYSRLERWHYLSFLKAETGLIKGLIAQAEEPDKLRSLLYIVENDLGYDLHRAVQKTKFELSKQHETTFEFLEHDLSIASSVSRDDFESWISHHLRSIESCVERLLLATATAPRAVDRVFLTGGSSFVPAVRQMFYRLFGEEKVAMGDEFTSVATGLALFAAEHSPD
jgi:hypothetical chaperone protein